MTLQQRVLNIGCGPKSKSRLHRAFHGPEWDEVRLDIDKSVEPDIVGSIVDMWEVPTASFDAVWSSHNVEHLHAHEVQPAFREIRRVLKPGGFLLVTCPDIEVVARLIAEGKLDEPAYVSSAGPITPIDILFGHGASIASGQRYMAHNTGFSLKRLGDQLVTAGFTEARGLTNVFDLWMVGAAGSLDLARRTLGGLPPLNALFDDQPQAIPAFAR